jgi:hypothetical protein
VTLSHDRNGVAYVCFAEPEGAKQVRVGARRPSEPAVISMACIYARRFRPDSSWCSLTAALSVVQALTLDGSAFGNRWLDVNLYLKSFRPPKKQWPEAESEGTHGDSHLAPVNRCRDGAETL